MPVHTSRVATQKCWYQRLWFYAHSDCECTAELLEAGNVRFGVEIAKDPEQLRKSCATWKRLIDKLDGATRRHLQVCIAVIIVCLCSLSTVCLCAGHLHATLRQHRLRRRRRFRRGRPMVRPRRNHTKKSLCRLSGASMYSLCIGASMVDHASQ